MRFRKHRDNLRMPRALHKTNILRRCMHPYPQVIPAEAVETDCHFDSASRAHGKSKQRKQDRQQE